MSASMVKSPEKSRVSSEMKASVISKTGKPDRTINDYEPDDQVTFKIDNTAVEGSGHK